MAITRQVGAGGDLSNFPATLKIGSTRVLPLTEDKRPTVGKVAAPDGSVVDVRREGIAWEPAIEAYLSEGGWLGVLLAGQFVALDADVKARRAAGDGFIKDGDGHVRVVEVTGEDQIQEIFADCGMAMPETLIVRSKSGGTHAVFRQNPDAPLTTDTIRAHGYVDLDVLGSPVRYLAWGGVCEVMADVEPAVLPREVAEYLGTLRGSRTAGIAHAGRARGTGAVGGDRLEDTGHYVAHGLPAGVHDLTLKRLAARFAATGMATPAAVEILKLCIAATEVDAVRGGWSEADLARKVDDGRQYVEAQREMDNTAGQEVLCTLSSTSSYEAGTSAQNASSCEFIPSGVLDDPERILSKLRAENDGHPLSLDWLTAPIGRVDEHSVPVEYGARDIYTRVMTRLATGGEVTASFLSFLDPSGDAISWLTSADHPLLLVTRERVFALPDLKRDQPGDKYPGWSYDRDPKSGDSWTREYRERTEAAYLEFLRSCPGQEHADRIAAAYLNDQGVRERFRMTDLRAATRGHIARLRTRLMTADAIHLVKKAESYRRKHAWMTTAAGYAPGPRREHVVTQHRARTTRRLSVDQQWTAIPETSLRWVRSLGER